MDGHKTTDDSFGRKLYTLLEAQPRDTKAEVFLDRASVAIVLIGLFVGALLTVKDLAPYYRLLEWTAGVILATIALEYGLRVWSSGFDPDDRYPQGLERLRFAFKPLNFIDVVAVVCGVFGIVFNNRQVMLLGLSVRLLRIFAFSQADDLIIAALRRAWPFFKSALTIWSITIIFATIFIYWFEKDAQPDKYADVFQAFYWSVVTFTSTGYGDMSPVTVGGKLFTCLYMLCVAAIVLGLPIGVFTVGFMEEVQTRMRPSQSAPVGDPDDSEGA
ncbi:MAG: ion transporter [Armatimonadetes bacterium]|nr:ion transporter [Armatimonadota bacterium]